MLQENVPKTLSINLENFKTRFEVMQYVNREFLLMHLRLNNWNIPQTAKKLNVSASNLHGLIKRNDLTHQV